MKKNAQAKAKATSLTPTNESKIEVDVNNLGATHKDYDEMPYESHAYPFSSPVSLYTLAKLFKIDAADFKTARVLELGCASGGNIIPYAINYPKANFVGVELSKRHVDQGNKRLKSLGLKNVHLKHMSIADVKEDLGKFDYIVTHGVYSWVPEEVQEKIFQICQNHLADNGIAYISYNTQPGWNMIQTIRDMMMYHTAKFKTLAEKAQQARLLLNFIKESMGKDATSPYAKLIEEEGKLLANQADYYLIHDHLNRDNNPCYFHEFIEKATKHKLAYVSDVDISQMYLGSLPENVRSVLSTIQNDIVRTEQYIDFLTNRRFRMSLLCKDSLVVNRILNPADIKNFYLRTKIEKKGQDYQLSGLKNLTVNVTNNPVVGAMCEVFSEQRSKSALISDLDKKIQQKLGAKEAKSDMKSIILQNILEIILRGGGLISADKDNYVMEISERPKVSKLARQQVSEQVWVTNQRYEKVATDLFSRILLKYADGTKTHEELKDLLFSHVEKGDISVNRENKKLEDKKEIKEVLVQLISTALASFAKNALLVA